MEQYTYQQIANSFNLWQEYVDPSATMTEDEFDALTEDEKIQMQVESFGIEAQCAECDYITNQAQDMDDHQTEANHSGLTDDSLTVSSTYGYFYQKK